MVTSYQAGSTTKDLAYVYGIHHTTVSGLLKRNGVTLRAQRLSPDYISLAIELDQGWSLARVGRRFSCVPNTVRATLIDAELQRRDTHSRPKAEDLRRHFLN